MRRTADLRPDGAAAATWWHDAVFYQVYVRSFADAGSDGVGDLEGVRSRLGYLELLGVDALWLTPFFRSPMADHGYDVADPRSVDPLFGDLAAFDRLVADAHARGMKVTVDLVPNHTSDQHPWFQEAVTAPPDSPSRKRYHFREGRGEAPPNNWASAFGGPAWTRLADGHWYLHLFSPQQPDLNWDDSYVRADLVETMRFWLDRGVDGFRVDVAHGMAKTRGLPDAAPGGPDPRFDDEAVHDVHRLIRRVLDEYPGTMACGEVRVDSPERFSRYIRPDELHLGFSSELATADFDADAVRRAVERCLAGTSPVGGTPTWTLSDHDTVRHVSRYGDGLSGARRARAMALVQLALPGVAYLYNGDELGLPQVDLPDWARQDPLHHRSNGAEPGRDGARVPLPWEGAASPFGFSEGRTPWLPMPDDWVRLTVEAQLEDPDSMLSLYRQAVELRKGHSGFKGTELEWYGAPPGCFAFRRKGGGLICALNTSPAPVPLPPGEILLSSAPLEGTLLPPDASVWLV